MNIEDPGQKKGIGCNVYFYFREETLLSTATKINLWTDDRQNFVHFMQHTSCAKKTSFGFILKLEAACSFENVQLTVICDYSTSTKYNKL